MGGGQGDLCSETLDRNVDRVVPMLVGMLAKTGAVEDVSGELKRLDILATDAFMLD